jgi:transcriptional regulator with XRE-family HTH domain
MEQTIGARIKDKRKEMGFTQEQLAEKVGVTYQAVSKWETDVSYPDVVLMAEVARALGTSLDWLATGSGDNTGECEKIRAFYGKITGTVTKDIHADVGKILGDVQADIYGDVKEDITGTVRNIFGNVEGNVVGTVNGDVTGYIHGNLIGTVTGSVKLGVHGRILGQIIGDGINVDDGKKKKK